MPKNAILITAAVEIKPDHAAGTKAPMKMVAMRICVGQRPLQREKLFVMIAMSRSLGLSMILVATTPAALQPQPILIVKACFPWAPLFLNNPSKLKATLGKYPKSSNRVNKGKKIAIGGSITAITQATAIYMPSKNNPSNHQGTPI